MDEETRKHLIKIITKEFDMPTRMWPPDRSKHPYLVIAPSYCVFEHWCWENKINYRKRPLQAVYIFRAYYLRGRTNLRRDLVILGYPTGSRGEEMRYEVEALLARDDERNDTA